MNKRTKRLLGGFALATGALGALGTLLIKKKKKNVGSRNKKTGRRGDVWARPGMSVTFRAELMPGRDREERTFKVVELLPNGRVLLDRAAGEHAENEFERAR